MKRRKSDEGWRREKRVKRERRKSDEVEEGEEGKWGESVIPCVHSLIFMINFKVCVCVCVYRTQ